MTCAACTAAERAPLAGHPIPGCKGCIARMLAGTGAHLASRAAGRITPEYLEALRKLFGDEWQQGAAQVKEWAARMNADITVSTHK